MDKDRLIWASRRGMLELDLILIPFLENHYSALSEADKAAYQLLLKSEDQDLFAWFMKKSRPEDPILADIVDKVNGSRPQPH